ncbi:alpha/beta fold hydrolase [Deinococcus sp.]|uniref:alpha/beta fold hydrolase n=1 Tax=Deinococcus sp. TaxID=47478 RepID=UPI003B5BC2DE
MKSGRWAFVHGFGTSHRIWRRVLEGGEFADALTPDLPGFGDAATLGRIGQTTGDMAAGLAEALRLAGPGPYRLAAHSMGGKVALLLAASHPELVAELLLVAPSPPSPEPMTPESRVSLRAAHGDREALREQYHQALKRDIPDEDFEQLILDGLRASEAAWTAWPDVGSREDIRGQLGGLRPNLPIMVLYSQDDSAMAPQTIVQDVLAALPQARSVRIKGSGHFIPLEDPQAVKAQLTRA